MKNVVKYCVYLDILLMGSIYVIKSTFLRGTPISGQNKSLRVPPRTSSLNKPATPPHGLMLGQHGAILSLSLHVYVYIYIYIYVFVYI